MAVIPDNRKIRGEQIKGISGEGFEPKFIAWEGQAFDGTYSDLNTSIGTNSFGDSDLPENSVHRFTLSASDIAGNPSTGSTLYLRIFGQEFQILNPPLNTLTVHLYKYDVLIIVNTGVASSRSITIRILNLESSSFYEVLGNPQQFDLSQAFITADIDLTTPKKIEVRQTIIDGGMSLHFAEFKRIN